MRSSTNFSERPLCGGGGNGVCVCVCVHVCVCVCVQHEVEEKIIIKVMLFCVQDHFPTVGS